MREYEVTVSVNDEATESASFRDLGDARKWACSATARWANKYETTYTVLTDIYESIDRDDNHGEMWKIVGTVRYERDF